MVFQAEKKYWRKAEGERGEENRGTVNNKKKHPPCFSVFRFSRISPEPLELQNIYYRLFASFSKALSAGTRIFHIR